MKRVIPFLLAGMLVLSLGAFLWSLLPPENISRTINFPTDLQQFYGNKKIKISMPMEIRVGETSHLLMRIEKPSPDGNDSVIPYFKARVDVPGLKALPEGTIGTQYRDQEGVRFSWELIPLSTGSFEGTIWVYASPGDDAKTGIPDSEPIFALPVTIEIQRVLGLQLEAFRLLCLSIAVITGITLAIMAVRNKEQPEDYLHKSQG